MNQILTILKIIGFAILVAIFLFLSFPVMDAFKNQVTVYPISKDFEAKESPLNRSIYKVNTNTQTVISWLPGIYEVPSKLVNCSVRDRLHWRCVYSDGSGILIMNDDRFEINPIEPGIYYVSRLKWWLLSLGL